MLHVARLTAALLLVCAATSLPWQGRGAHAQSTQPLLVIVGKATPIDDVSLATLRRVFQGEPTTYAAGERLIPFNFRIGTPERTRFDRIVLGLSRAETGRYWIDRRIRDEGAPPRLVPSASIAVKLVASLRGAICYVSDTSLSPAVRVLTVDGKAPGQPGYPLAAY